ncbi:hypothetical protein TcBrA4_0010110 [Trypanosoma cruzi]|nr:hypothetical protein TcBrA4_0010110 [Trypanosoma cruzi]
MWTRTPARARRAKSMTAGSALWMWCTTTATPETSYDKNSYMAHIRGYMKQLLERIEDEEEKKKFQANAAAFVKRVIKEIDEYQFFIPEGNEEDPDNGMIVLCKWDGEVPYFYYWKDGVKGERV